jgi:type II secretory ATPase GspE/PulE/Tfp pilus assembly ATPase PilB-like protein
VVIAPGTDAVEDREEVWLVARLKQRGVTEEQLRSALALFQKARERNSRATFGGVLTEVGIVSQADLARLISEHYHLALCELSRETVAPELIRLLGGSTARRCKTLVLSRTGDVATVVVAEPTRRCLQEITMALATAGVFGRTKDQLAAGAPAHDFKVAPASDILDRLEEALTPRVSIAEIATGRKHIENVLRQAVEDRASDVHFIPRERALEIKYRIDGKLWTVQLVGADSKDGVIANAKMYGKLDVGKKLIPLDGQSLLEIGSRTIKLRFSSMPTQYGEKVVVRLLDQSAAILPFAELGMTPADALEVQDAMSAPFGLVFMVGPTGSGKSTTLASLISQLDGNSFSIRTLENPIEYKLANAEQTSVTDEMTFALGLRALLRQDPDYILVGETRDLETANIAIEAGLTGHMCFSTLHGNDGIGGIIRLLDLGVEVGPMIAACNVFIAQRLVRRLCPSCRRPSEDSAELLERYRVPHHAGQHLWEPVGCCECRDGFLGRVGIYEVRTMADFADAVIAKGKECMPACREIVAKKNLGTMLGDGFAKALQGATTIDEVFSQIVS